MNHPVANVSASHKIEQLTTARALGFSVPQTLVTHAANVLRAFYSELDGRVVAKPMARGYVERANEPSSIIYTNRVLPAHIQDLGDLSTCPTLFQEYISKASDVRITVVDSHVIAVKMDAKEEDGT